jgi:uncharacterized protein YdeI (YjbR/CyaY-like superfamily)
MFDPLITDYIAKKEAFAQPILNQIREIVHQYCPDTTETLKWGMPHFLHNGSILCSMAAFKQHCAMGFWLQSQMKDEFGLFKREQEGGMGSMGKMRDLNDVPPAVELGSYLLEAKALIDNGVKLKKTVTAVSSLPEIPSDFQLALNADALVNSHFQAMSNSHKKEYLVWLLNAKTSATFSRRLSITMENLREGKSKEWKYKK